MHRFFCPPENISQDKATITDKKELHHILDVLRLKKNASVCIFDGKHTEYQATIEEILKNRLILKIKEKKDILPSKGIKIAVGCAIPKARRFDLLVEKLTELGVKEIIPLRTERTQVLINKDKEKDRLKHWQRIALQATKQSKRLDLPLIQPQTAFQEVLKRKDDYELCLICTPSGKAKKIKAVLKENLPQSVLVLIGPEGDFSPQELNVATEKGFIPVYLGDFTLRVETAAIAVCAFLRLL